MEHDQVGNPEPEQEAAPPVVSKGATYKSLLGHAFKIPDKATALRLLGKPPEFNQHWIKMPEKTVGDFTYGRAIREHANNLWLWTAPEGKDGPLKFTVLKARDPEKCRNTTLVNALLLTGKPHKKTKRMSEAYHQRVQKKWDKRAAAGDKRMQIGTQKVLSLPRSMLTKIDALQEVADGQR